MHTTGAHTPRLANKLLLVGALLACLVSLVWAEPFHHPTIDGEITGDGTDWAPADLVVDDAGDDVGPPRNVRRLWSTWDADSLYIGVTYEDFETGLALSLFLDLDKGIGPLSATVLDSFPGNFVMPDSHGFELVLGRSTDQPWTNQTHPWGDKAPRAMLVTDSDGSVAVIDTLAHNRRQRGSIGGEPAKDGDPDNPRYVFHNNAEIALPWSVLYDDLAGGVPANAVIKLVAVTTAGAATHNGYDSAPDNPGLDGGTSPVTFINLVPAVVDADGDGQPDPADATVSGTVALPNNPDPSPPVTVVAEMIDFAGRDPGAPISTTITDENVREWTLGRLPAGKYRITTSAEGYFAGSVVVDVAESQAVTGADQTLDPATGVSGTLSFAGPGRAGTATIRDSGGAEISTLSFGDTGGPYTFWVLESGDYTISATAPTYLTAEVPVSVTAGQDVTGVDIELQRQTMVAGSVTFSEGPGSTGMIYFEGEQGEVLDAVGFVEAGGPFEFFTPQGGTFTLAVRDLTSNMYVPVDSTLAVTAGVDQTAIIIDVPLAAEITGTVSFEGPAAEGWVRLFEGVGTTPRDSTAVSNPGDAFSFFLAPGEYRINTSAPGYVERDTFFTVAREDMDLGDQSLTAVRATHLVLIDPEGNPVDEIINTVSIPEDDQWFIGPVDMAARDDAGRDDLYDIDNNLTNFRLTASKMDDLSPPRGAPGFYASEDLSDISAIVDFVAGRARFWMTNDAVEVLRVFLAQPGKDPIAGRIVVAFQDPQPVTVVLTAVRDTMVADNLDEIVIEAQLYDSARNPSPMAEIPATFAVTSESSGVGGFDVASVVTNADGKAQALLRATGSGTLKVTCSVVVANRTLEVVARDLDSGLETLDITAVAGPTAAWRMVLPGLMSDLVSPVSVTAQLIDAYGNPTAEAGLSINFSADPPTLGTFDPFTAVSDTTGRAISLFTPTGNSGLVTLFADGGALPGDESGLRLRDVLVAPDPVWQEEPRTRQTFPQTDLTALVVDNTADELLLEIPFSTSWGDLQMHIIFETGFDAAGASSDPFEMPVNYGQSDKPDYALTYKYSVNDYGDFRRWSGSDWEFWNLTSGEYQNSGQDGQNIKDVWVAKDGDALRVHMPWDPFGGRPDSLRVEAYLTQEEDGVKRSAFDSAPLDSTLNLTFDPDDPDAPWDIALGPVTLRGWSEVYTIKTDFPDPPTVPLVTVSPSELDAGEPFTLTATVINGGDGIGDVLANLAPVGGGALTRMYDDGNPAHGDQVAGDGVYGVMGVVSPAHSGGTIELVVAAFDGSNTSHGTGSANLAVVATIDPILTVVDPIGDDHGPNQSGTATKYYTYPTNSAFVTGGFDIHQLDVYETTALVGGEEIEMIAFQVTIGDLPDPADPGTANWSPDHADLNIQKIDILIDSGPGGATATLPNRQAAFQPWDGWEYAVIMDGWYKAIIPSLGQNTVDAWRQAALRADKDILLVGDFENDTITAFVSRTVLGEPTREDILGWDMVVCIAGHDFGGEEVLGGIRWVNESRGEWQFGGGKNEDRDSNLIDLLLVPGSGHGPGLTQEEILDYESPAALQRLDSGLTPVAIEMSAFEDTGPPVIDVGGDGSVVRRVDPLEDAPLTLSFVITDDYRVETATFRYRSSSFVGDGWAREVPMGFLGLDRWVVDILPSWLDSNLVYSHVDSNRYLEFEITASDPLEKTSTSPVTTLQITPDRLCRRNGTDLGDDGINLLQIDGSALLVSDTSRDRFIRQHIEDAWTGGDVSADTMGSEIQLEWVVCETIESIKSAQSVPAGTPLGVFRNMFLATTDTLGGYRNYPERLPLPVEFSLHYPQEWVPNGADENKIAMYEYNLESNRWVLVGGNVTPTGNNVTTTVNRTGTFGLFYNGAMDYDTNEVISGITISPNPFSPNGDGLYDEATISFYLTTEATVTVEIYNINGARKQVLTESFPFAGSDPSDPTPRRVSGLIWDGRDVSGDPVPYGVYVLRIVATYNQAGGTRSVRSNHSLAVIR